MARTVSSVLPPWPAQTPSLFARPYDDSVIGEIPAADRRRRRPRRSPSPRPRCTPAAAAVEAGRRSSTRPRQLLTERRDEFADDHRQGGGQADQDGSGRGRARRRHVPVRRRRGAQAVAARWSRSTRSPAGEGKLGFTLRVPIGVVGAIAPFNFPLNLVAHKVAPAIAAGCPVVLKPASQTPFSSIALAEMLIDECGLPAEYLHVVTGGGGTVGNAHRRPPRHRPDHVHRVARRRLGRSGPGRRASGSGSSWATTRRSSSSPTATGRPPRPRSRSPGSATPARAASRRSASTSTARSPTTSPRRWSSTSTSLVVGDPLDEATDVSALISTGERDRVEPWIDEADAAGAKVADRRRARRRRRAAADGHHQRDARHEGLLARRCSGPVVAIAAYDDLDDAFALANDTDVRPAGGDLHHRHRQGAARRAHARLRRRAGQRGAHVARRPAAVRRPARQRQHPRGPGVLASRR